MTTPLADILARQIATTGPMTLADYMAACLMHPQYGYYSTRDPLGAGGDFTTAPEISQMFGELLGLSLAQCWLDQGAPTPFILAELGPGRGTLMADILRATARVPGFHAAARLHLVETSPSLRAEQAKRLPQATWHDAVQTLPDGPLFLVANEFFDALPVRQFQRDGEDWRERVVGLHDDHLVLGLAAPAPQPGLIHRQDDTKDGDLVETCAPGQAIVAVLGARIATQGGIALLIDYGDWRSLGDTLQALKGHAPIDPFAQPGESDLTTHVDFEALARAAAPAAHTLLTPQGVFLERLGITQRAQALAKSLSGPALDSHIAAHRRLTHPDEMGSLFKTLALLPQGAPPPPGLELRPTS
ncbi:putative S-adenosyl-L-methionine-dependent methyltransferase [Antarctobacter heliothermus]|uniref:Putative S-adenosyl-L-methionine-dependent methyltransferase n=2 Tax=Antarctobacter heliothermus TaxID=74033 RepID=A0A222E2L2_9RHOB|nr:putative S-adenosyl-L-methionine-dependent methyltransferase [Antarctobacter heliothermus]